MTKTETTPAAGGDLQAKVTGVKKLLANFKKKFTSIKKQVGVIASWVGFTVPTRAAWDMILYQVYWIEQS